MPYPKDLKELCDRLRPYHDDLGHWLRRRQMEIDDLLGKAGLPNHYPPKGSHGRSARTHRRRRRIWVREAVSGSSAARGGGGSRHRRRAPGPLQPAPEARYRPCAC